MSSQLAKAISQNLAKMNTLMPTILAQTTKTNRCDLLAVSKTKPIADILAAHDAGQRRFGENYVEEFVEKANTLAQSHPDIEWHFVGHIQSNKAKKLAQCLNLSVIETVDSIKLVNVLNKECGKVRAATAPLDVLVQVLAMDTEGTKYGVAPDAVSEMTRHIRESCPFLRFRGLMSMGALGNVQEFRIMHQLKTDLLQSGQCAHLTEDEFILSMGTSQDYEPAIIEGGATQVRLGTTIFGPRDYSKK